MSRTRVIVGLLLVATGVLLWQLPELARPDTQAPMEVTPTAPAELARVDAFLDGALERVGADDVLASQVEDGVEQAIHRLPPGADAVSAGERIRAMAEEAGVEVYVHSPDQLDAELRVYAGRDLRAHILLVPDVTAAPRAPASGTLRERPLLALVITGLGERDAAGLIGQDLPLTLGIRPYAPFSLRIARQALQHWHEILVHLPEGGDAAALASVPWASGLVLDGGPRPDLPTVAFGVLVYPVAAPVRRPPTALTAVPAQRPARLGALETLTRARTLAVRDGAATVMLDYEDPELDAVLTWARAAHTAGFRIALASEVARSSDVRGTGG